MEIEKINAIVEDELDKVSTSDEKSKLSILWIIISGLINFGIFMTIGVIFEVLKIDLLKNTILLVIVLTFGLFIASFLSGYFSNEKTILEPAISIFILLIVGNLLIKDYSGAIFSWIIPAFIAVVGALFGEIVQDIKSNKKNKVTKNANV